MWMMRNHAAIGCVCLGVGVGAAFPMLAGVMPRAPRLVQNIACEWLYRWIQEPRRLMKRYTVGNARFMLAALREIGTRRRAPQ
jgi:exopolysaccharide biosynthesis WecB/TagA/CpsF family protein